RSPDERALPALWRSIRSTADAGIRRQLRMDLMITLLPAIGFATLLGLTWNAITKPNVIQDYSGLEQMGGSSTGTGTNGGLREPSGSGLQEPPGSGLQEPPGSDTGEAPPTGLQEPPKEPEANLTPK